MVTGWAMRKIGHHDRTQLVQINSTRMKTIKPYFILKRSTEQMMKQIESIDSSLHKGTRHAEIHRQRYKHQHRHRYWVNRHLNTWSQTPSNTSNHEHKASERSPHLRSCQPKIGSLARIIAPTNRVNGTGVVIRFHSWRLGWTLNRLDECGGWRMLTLKSHVRINQIQTSNLIWSSFCIHQRCFIIFVWKALDRISNVGSAVDVFH